MMQPSENGNNSDKNENVEATPVAVVVAEKPTETARIQLQTVKSILKRRQNETGTQSLNKPNISWQDFHGQDLTVVHEFEPRCEHL